MARIPIIVNTESVMNAVGETLHRYWKLSKEKSPWRIIPDTPESLLDAIGKGAAFASIPSFVGDNPPTDDTLRRYTFLPLDFDDKANPKKALEESRQLITYHLPELYEDFDPAWARYYCSGKKGFHVELPIEMFGKRAIDGHALVPLAIKMIVAGWKSRFDLDTLDCSLYCMGKGKMYRLPNVQRSNGRFKVELTPDEFQFSKPDDLWALADNPRELDELIEEPEVIGIPELVSDFDKALDTVIASHEKKPSAPPLSDDQRKKMQGQIAPCIGHIVAAIPKKNEHINFNRLAWLLVDYFQAAGFDLNRSLQYCEHFLNNYSHSDSYNSADKRRKEFEKLWHYCTGNDSRFHCGLVKSLHLPGTAFECSKCDLQNASNTLDESMDADDADDGKKASILLPDPPPCPIDIFPPQIEQMLHVASEAFQTPGEVAKSAILALLSACVGRTLGISPKYGWVEHGNLFMALVGATGLGKSYLVKAFFGAVYEVEREWEKDFSEKMNQYLADIEIYQKKLKNRQDDSDEIPVKPDKPKRKQLYIDDSTVEALADGLADNPKGLLWLRDEIDGMFSDFDKYSSGKDGGTKARLMTSYDSGAWKINRKSGNLYIPHACVGIFGSVQPEVLQKAFDEIDKASGWMPRFIMLLSKRHEPAQWTDVTLSDEYKDLLKKIIDALLSIQMLGGNELMQTPGDTPHVVTLENEAKKIFIKWHDEIKSEPWRDPESLEAINSKLIGQCLRVCLLLHALDVVMEHDQFDATLKVQADTMRRAIRLVDWIKKHQRIIWNTMGGCKVVAPTPIDERIVRSIVRLESEIRNGRLFVSQIVTAVNAGIDEAFQLSAITVGKILRKIGLHGGRTKDGRYVKLSESIFEGLKYNFT